MSEERSQGNSSTELLAQLRSRDRSEAWKKFLEVYSPVIMHIAGQYEYRRGGRNDCYLFICEKLSKNDFCRLLSYQPEGSASFRSWLNVVIANLCIDWRRHKQGRPRPFKSISNLPLFEQAVAVGASEYSKRVTFGIAYAKESILECFEANRIWYPVILPELMDVSPEKLAHLRLHNGTIWRWNRPLIGFSVEGEPHCRIEHRVVAAGPTPLDAIANTALFLGLFEALMRSPEPLESQLPFGVARDNFYAAARYGLAAKLRWIDGKTGSLAELLSSQLLDTAAEGLAQAGLKPAEIEQWLGIIRGRVERQVTGADWQIDWVRRHGRDFAALVDNYAERQATNTPVHEWSLK